MNKMLENVMFEPSVTQLKFAEIYLDYTKKRTLEGVTKEVGITYKTTWVWFQDKNFVNWLGYIPGAKGACCGHGVEKGNIIK